MSCSLAACKENREAVVGFFILRAPSEKFDNVVFSFGTRWVTFLTLEIAIRFVLYIFFLQSSTGLGL